MTSGIEGDLRGFAVKLLQRRGGLVEWPAGSPEGTAIVPEKLAAALDADDGMLRLASEPGAGGWCVSLATDFLETAGELLAGEPRVGTFRVRELYLKSGDLDETVRRAFTWLNAKVKIAGTRPVRVEYHTWWFHASMVSEDQWQTRFPVTINALTGVEVELPDPLGLWELEPRRRAGRTTASTYDQALARAQARLRRLAAGFLERMDGRLDRDRKRLREYYGALLKEAGRKKPRGRAQADPEKIEARKRAVHLELRRKLAELDERYAVEATLDPLVLVRTELPALAVDLAVYRKRACRNHAIYWNPLLKRLEPICCHRCRGATFSVAFTNDQVEPLCPACAG